MPGSDPLALVGQVLDGTYRIDALVGEGGFGVVYKAFHLGFEEPVAVKCLKIPGSFAPETREAFLRKFREEGKLLFQLSQGTLGIVRSIALGDTTTPAGVWTPFVVLEWLEGTPLSTIMHDRRRRGMQGRPLGEVMAWLEQPARALAYAHGKRVAHRDIKPANLFVMHGSRAGAAPQLKLLDFGIAKVMEEGASAFRKARTQAGFTSFTPRYAAPEQFDPSIGPTGPWSDVYSFALVVVEMLTDRAPADGDDAVGLMSSAVNRSIRPTPRMRGAQVPDAVEEVFARALCVDPTMRFADLATFWDALGQAVSAQGQRGATQVVGAPGSAMPSALQPQGYAPPMPQQACPTPYSVPPELYAQPVTYPEPAHVDSNMGMQTYPTPFTATPYAATGPMTEAGRPSSGSRIWVWVSFGFAVGLAIMLGIGALTCTTCVCVSM